MTTAPHPLIKPGGPSLPDADLHHVVCAHCYPEGAKPILAFCGTDVTDDRKLDHLRVGPDLCVVCAQLDLKPCPGCGR